MDYEPFPGTSKPVSVKFPRKKALRWTAITMATVMAITAGLVSVLYISGDWLRFKGAVAFHILGHTPAFYYLDIEKNGKDYRMKQGDTLELASRDEFMIRQAVTDVFSGKNISIDVELIGSNNDTLKLLKGNELVRKVVAMGSSFGMSSDAPPSPRILVKYGPEIIGQISLKTKVTPQDWLQQSGTSENLKSRIEQLQKALLLNPSDTNVRRVLSALYLQAGLQDKAIEQYQTLLSSSNPDDVFLLTELARAYMGRRNFTRVIETCRRIVTFERNNAAAFAHMGYAYGELGDWNKAVESYEASVKIDSGNYPVRFRLGEAYGKIKRYSDAGKAYRIVLAGQPDSLQALAALADLSLKMGQYDEAIRRYKDIVRLQPGNSAAYANLGLAYGGRKMVSKEIESYQKALSLDPKNATARYNPATAYERGKNEEKAVKTYQAVLKARPNDLEALKRLADLDLKERRYGEAVKKYEQLVHSSTTNPSVYANLGYAYSELKNYAQSVKYYEKAVKAGIKDFQIYYNLGFVYEKLGRERDAIRAYEKYEKEKPSPEMTQIMARLYLGEKKYDQAIQAYRKLIKKNPKKAAWYTSLGYAYGRKGDINNEINSYKTALRYDPEDDETYYHLAEAYERKGMYEEALAAYSNAYDLNPELSQAARKIPRLKIKILEKKHQES